jgi:hypothetical protein
MLAINMPIAGRRPNLLIHGGKGSETRTRATAKGLKNGSKWDRAFPVNAKIWDVLRLLSDDDRLRLGQAARQEISDDGPLGGLHPAAHVLDG